MRACKPPRQIIRLLLEAGADPGAGQGQAFANACLWGNADAVRAFLEHGADVDAGRGRALRVAAAQ